MFLLKIKTITKCSYPKKKISVPICVTVKRLFLCSYDISTMCFLFSLVTFDCTISQNCTLLWIVAYFIIVFTCLQSTAIMERPKSEAMLRYTYKIFIFLFLCNTFEGEIWFSFFFANSKWYKIWWLISPAGINLSLAKMKFFKKNMFANVSCFRKTINWSKSFHFCWK